MSLLEYYFNTSFDWLVYLSNIFNSPFDWLVYLDPFFLVRLWHNFAAVRPDRRILDSTTTMPSTTNTLRPYQLRIVESIGHCNAIVKMPTGSGKTIVGAKLLQRRLLLGASNQHHHPLVRPAGLILVPTQDLVHQQHQVFAQWCGTEPTTTVLSYMGGMADPILDTSKTCLLVSTPKAFTSLQQRKQDMFTWDKFGAVLFDEVHHVLKDHPYRTIALSLRDWHEQQKNSDHPQAHHKIQVLGLSASLTYGVDEPSIRATLDRLCRELDVQKMESPSTEELVQGGYVPPYGNNVELERASEVPEGVTDRASRKPHLMHATFRKRIQNQTATSFTINVWNVVGALEKQATLECREFVSPLSKPKLVSWEEYAHKMALSTGILVFRVLQVWYTALRLLVQSWEEEEVLAMQWLKQNDAFSTLGTVADVVRSQCENPDSFYKLGRLRYHLIQKKKNKSNAFQCLIFVQQRIAAHIVCRFIEQDAELGRSGIRPGYVTAKDGKITPTITMTNGRKQQTVADFRSGRINVIVATSVLEEVCGSGSVEELV